MQSEILKTRPRLLPSLCLLNLLRHQLSRPHLPWSLHQPLYRFKGTNSSIRPCFKF